MHEYDPTTGRFIDTSIVAKRAAMDKTRRDQREADYQDTQRRAADAQAAQRDRDLILRGQANALPDGVRQQVAREPSKAPRLGVSRELADFCQREMLDELTRQRDGMMARQLADIKAGRPL